MYLWSALHLFAFVNYLYLAIYVLVINPRERLNHACIAAILCMAVWSLEYTVVHFPGTSYENARLWLRFGALGWTGLPPALLWFVYIFTGQGQQFKKFWYHAATTLPWIVFYIAQWQWLIVDQLVPKPYGWSHTFSHSAWTLLFCIYYVGLVGWSLFLLARFQRKTQRRTLKILSGMLFGVIFACLLFASITDIILPMMGLAWLPPMGSLVTLIWAAGLAYALVKYKFLTISPATAAENILDTMSDLLILCDPQGKIVTINHAASQMLGHSTEDVRGVHLLNFVEDPNLQEPNSFSQCFGKISIDNVRINLRTSSGNRLAVMLSSSLLTDAQGELAGMVTVAKDISALDHAEQALRASEKRYRELVENINDVIFTINLEGIITFVSPRVSALSGYSPEELVGRHIETVIHEDERPKAIKRLGSVSKGDAGATNYRFLNKDGSFLWARVSSRPILQEGDTVGIQGVIADITPLINAMEEKLELEAKLSKAQKMEAIGTLAGGVAHDLNNILSGISSYPEFLLMKLPKDSALRKPLELINRSGIKAAAIVQDLLTLARRGVAHFEVLNLNQVIKDFFSSPEYHKQRSFFPGASVETELAPDLYNIKGSNVHLTKSVMNLLTNAFEALFKGGRISITTKNRHLTQEDAARYDAPTGDYVVLSIQDNGKGIAAEDLDRIFEPFYSKKVMGRSGTGLGMAVVWGTVRDHKGIINVRSKPDHGTCFDLYFPATKELLDEKAGPLPEEMYQGAGETILIVDDVPEQRTISSAMLAQLGYRVHTATSGEEALTWVQEQSADLVILDMIMDPGMDGLETLQKILAIYPGQKAIIASGYSETDRVRQALKLGALGYLRKPFSVEEIGMAVQAALNVRSTKPTSEFNTEAP